MWSVCCAFVNLCVLLLLHVIVIIAISHTCFVVFEICLVSWFALVVIINTIIILCFIIFGLILKQSVFLMHCKDFLSSPCSCLKQKNTYPYDFLPNCRNLRVMDHLMTWRICRTIHMIIYVYILSNSKKYIQRPWPIVIYPPQDQTPVITGYPADDPRPMCCKWWSWQSLCYQPSAQWPDGNWM